MLPSLGFSILTKELTAATRLMQSSSHELSTPVSGNANRKQKKANEKFIIIPKLTKVTEAVR